MYYFTTNHKFLQGCLLSKSGLILLHAFSLALCYTLDMKPDERNNYAQKPSSSSTENVSPPVQTNSAPLKTSIPAPTTLAHASSKTASLKPKRKISAAKAFVIFVCLILPLLFLAYRLFVGWYYTPESAYARNKDKIAAAGKEAEKNSTADMLLITQKLEEIYKETFNQTNLTAIAKGEPSSDDFKDLIEDSNLLIKYDGESYSNGCFQYEYYAGSKWDRHPVGDKAFCAYSLKKAYYWLGSKEYLQKLIESTQKSTGKTISIAESYRAKVNNNGINAGIFNLSEFEYSLADIYFQSASDYSSSDANLKWSEVFSKSGSVNLPEPKNSQNNRGANSYNDVKALPYYVLIISIQNEYQTLYERNF